MLFQNKTEQKQNKRKMQAYRLHFFFLELVA